MFLKGPYFFILSFLLFVAPFLPGLEVVLAEFVTVGYCFEPSFALCVCVCKNKRVLLACGSG